MPNTWFRCYAEFATDPKVQKLSEVMQRRLIMLFCAQCSDVLVTFCDEDIAFYMRVTEQELKETKALFVAKGFIDEDWNITNWNKRQYISDSSTSRTRRYRERKRTSRERHSDSDVTKCDGPDTDTEQIQKKVTPRKSVSRPALPEWIPLPEWEAFVEMRGRIRAPLTDRAITLTINELDRLRASGQHPGAVLDQSTQRNWRGIFALKTESQNGKVPPVASLNDASRYLRRD